MKSGPYALVYLIPLIGVTLLLHGCMPSIWNASDLAEWVREQAVKRGCQNDSITLDDWYQETKSGNVWHGRCLDDTGETMTFAVNVDSVWTPSKA